jgi:hypothetical protein
VDADERQLFREIRDKERRIMQFEDVHRHLLIEAASNSRNRF